MMGYGDIPIRLIVAAELVVMGGVRAYYSVSRRKEPAQGGPARRAESAWLTGTLAVLALLHFGAVFAYLANPSLVEWSAFEIEEPIRWMAIVISCLGVAGEIWAAISLGASYSPLLRVAEERVVVTAGPYRWIRHPLYAFWLPLMAGWGIAARNWFILFTGTVLILLLMIVRAPREEAMMLEGFGESYRQYMIHTGRFLPRSWSARGK
ncbi:MAG TPA: isoprenylcysteine carboxylmethyltransferase family protein [Candidatus Binataceae bacterium]|nr:isoprenylcysteine carboxylmethyltransferase family protein [Candidatus Binataceae bacterium]